MIYPLVVGVGIAIGIGALAAVIAWLLPIVYKGEKIDTAVDVKLERGGYVRIESNFGRGLTASDEALMDEIAVAIARHTSRLCDVAMKATRA